MRWEVVTSPQGWVSVAEKLLVLYPSGGVFGLVGPLGAGKTTFVREFIGVLCKRRKARAPRVISPSYVLHQQYDVEPTVDHFDLYRLEAPTEESLVEIGFFDAIDRSENGAYVFVEWAERLGRKQLPMKRLEIRFKENEREYLITDAFESL